MGTEHMSVWERARAIHLHCEREKECGREKKMNEKKYNLEKESEKKK